MIGRPPRISRSTKYRSRRRPPRSRIRSRSRVPTRITPSTKPGGSPSGSRTARRCPYRRGGYHPYHQAHGRRHAQDVGSMKKARSHGRDELRPSYKRSDFPGGFTRGKYATRLAAGSNVVVLSPENVVAFPTSDAVNEALNGLLRVAKSSRLTRRSSGRRSRQVARQRR